MVVIQGICYDEKSSFQKGPAKAPALIRERLWSSAYNSYAESGHELKREDLIDKGDFVVNDYWDIFEFTKSHMIGEHQLFTWGGDHSITYPVVKAFSTFYNQFDILHIDAHGDLYDEFEGDKFSHACPFARIMDDGLAQRLVQVGIRTLTDHQRDQAEKYNVEIIEMKNIDQVKDLFFHRPIYLSLDIDAFDPAFAPGVSHQESGGLNVRQVLSIIDKINVPILGADIVEYNPDNDVAGITEALCGKLSKEILTKMIYQG